MKNKKCEHLVPLFTIDYEYDGVKAYQCPICKEYIFDTEKQLEHYPVITLSEFDIKSFNQSKKLDDLINQLIEKAKKEKLNLTKLLLDNKDKLYEASIINNEMRYELPKVRKLSSSNLNRK